MTSTPVLPQLGDLSKPRQTALRRMSKSQALCISHTLRGAEQTRASLKKIRLLRERCESDTERLVLANLQDSARQSPLELAIRAGAWSVALDLLENGADANAEMSPQRRAWGVIARGLDKRGWTSSSKEMDLVPPKPELDAFLAFYEKLAQHCESQDPDHGRTLGWGAVQNAAMTRNPHLDLPMLEILEKTGHDLGMTDGLGESGFLLACWQCRPDMVLWFVERGVPLDSATQGGWDAWCMCVRNHTGIDEAGLLAGRTRQTLDILAGANVPFHAHDFEQQLNNLRSLPLRVVFDQWQLERHINEAAPGSGPGGRKIRL
jgi:hypothetical protein